MVAHVNSGRGFRTTVNKGWVGRPSLTSVLQVSLHATPFVPFQSTVAREQKQRDENQNDSTNLGDLNKVRLQVVYNGGIHLITEHDVILLRDGQRRPIEVDTCEGLVDIFLQQFEGFVNTKRYSNERCDRKDYVGFDLH